MTDPSQHNDKNYSSIKRSKLFDKLRNFELLKKAVTLSKRVRTRTALLSGKPLGVNGTEETTTLKAARPSSAREKKKPVDMLNEVILAREYTWWENCMIYIEPYDHG